MTRRGVISIHDYPEHLNPFREDEDEVQRKYTRKERGGPTLLARHGTLSQSPVKPERPPLPNRTKIKDKENEDGRRDEDKYFRQGTKPKKKRPAPLPPSPNQLALSPAVSDGSLDKNTKSPSPNAMEVSENSPEKEEQRSVPTTAEPPEVTDNGTLADTGDTQPEDRESPVNGGADAVGQEGSCRERGDQEKEGPETDEAATETEEATETEGAAELKVGETSPREEATCNGQSDEINTSGDLTELTAGDPKSSREEGQQTAGTTSGETNDEGSPKTAILEGSVGGDEETGSKQGGDAQVLGTETCDPEPRSKTPPVDSKESHGIAKTEEQRHSSGLDGRGAEGTSSASPEDIARKE